MKNQAAAKFDELDFAILEYEYFEKFQEDHKGRNALVFGNRSMYVAFTDKMLKVVLKEQQFNKGNSQTYVHHVKEEGGRKEISMGGRKFDWNGYKTEDNHALFEIVKKTK